MRPSTLLTLSVSLIGALALGCAPDAEDPNLTDGGTDTTSGVTTGGNTTTGGNNTTTGGNTTATQASTALRGQVLTPNGMPLEDVSVITTTGMETVTDATGRWGFDEFTDLGQIAVDFYLEGYAENQKPIVIQDGVEHALNTTLAPVDYVGAFDGRDGMLVAIADYDTTIRMPAGDYIYDDGTPIQGDVNIEATVFDVTWSPSSLRSAASGGSERNAAPGDLTAVDSEGDDQVLESFGMFQVNMYDDDGNPVELPEGETAIIGTKLQPSATEVGETIPGWSYDKQTYKWIEEGDGLVVETPEGDKLWQFETTHFSSWNCDQPVSTWGCVVCSTDELSQLGISGVTLNAQGVSYNGSTSGTESGGQVCVNVKNDSSVGLTMSYSLSGQTYTEEWSETVSIPAFEATCNDTSACTDIGACPIDIPW